MPRSGQTAVVGIFIKTVVVWIWAWTLWSGPEPQRRWEPERSLLTSMDGDGTKEGYDLELTRAVAESVSIPVIASGGAGQLSHFYDALTEGKAEAVLAASLFHYKELEIRQVKEYLREKESVSVSRDDRGGFDYGNDHE